MKEVDVEGLRGVDLGGVEGDVGGSGRLFVVGGFTSKVVLEG